MFEDKKDLWVADLRAHPGCQGRKALQTQGRKYCCLGRASLIAKQSRFIKEAGWYRVDGGGLPTGDCLGSTHTGGSDGYFPRGFLNKANGKWYSENNYLSFAAMEWLGIKDPDPSIPLHDFREKFPAHFNKLEAYYHRSDPNWHIGTQKRNVTFSELNDIAKLSFDEIADVIEEFWKIL